MADFQKLDQEQKARWVRWQLAYQAWQGAGLSLAAAIASARLTDQTEAKLKPDHPDYIALRAFLLRKRADALEEIKRSADMQRLAKVRMERLFGSWKPAGDE